MRYVINFILLILITLPSFYLYSKNLDSNILFISVSITIYIYALMKDSRYLLVVYPLVIIVPFILFYIYYYDSSINEQILGIVLETNWQEALGFLGTNIHGYIAVFSIWFTAVTAVFWYNHRYPLCWTHRSRWWIIISVSILAVSGIIANQVVANQIDANFSDNDANFLIDEKNSLLQDIKQTYPLGLVISISDLYQEQHKINQAFAKHQQFTFQATSLRPDQDKQLVVLVIGETSRRANWQLNGYMRATNPLLNTQKNVINFTDMLSVSAATRSSIPMLLTRKPATHVYSYDFAEKSVISAFKEAGFATYWLSTQQKFGTHDTSTSVYAKEADEVIFLNKTNYSHQGETDEVILPALAKILAAPNKKQLIVIHTLGSHFDYSHRYPAAFDIFRPSLNDLDRYSLQDHRYKQEITNSYDNSILFTDYVLNEVIETIKENKQTEAFLLYSSDHGEDLFDGQCDKSGHGNETVFNFEVASLAWYSQAFADKHPDKIQKLKINASKKTNHTSVFPTLIDAADIIIPTYHHERSVLGSLDPYPRLVMGSKDYDRSLPQGKCREIK